MFRVRQGNGIVTYEMEGGSDRVGKLDPAVLSGLPQEVISNYVRYRQKVDFDEVVSSIAKER